MCCDFGYLECLDSASMPFMSNFIKGCTIKILLELISKRSFKHLYKQMKYHVPRFGLIIGSVSFLFYLLMCFHHRGKFLKNRRGQAIFVAAMISALPIIGLKKNELGLVKLLFFPVAWRCFCQIMLKKKIVPSISRHGDILTYMALSWIIGMCMVFEAYSSPLNKAVSTYATFTPVFMRYMQTFKTMNRI